MTQLNPQPVHPIKLLIIEDDWPTIDQISAALTGTRYFVADAVPTVEAALQALARSDHRAAILDGTLRGQPTSPIAAKLSATGTPFMMLTASHEVHRNAIAHGIPALLKPFAKRELLAILDQLPIAAFR